MILGMDKIFCQKIISFDRKYSIDNLMHLICKQNLNNNKKEWMFENSFFLSKLIKFYIRNNKTVTNDMKYINGTSSHKNSK